MTKKLQYFKRQLTHICFLVRIFFSDETTEKMLYKENGLLICNHKFELDWLWVWMVADKYKSLAVSN